jgi:hypothetical protein
MFNRKPRNSDLRVAVLGVGPAGIFSAMALKGLGVPNVTIMARKFQKSPLYGAQYLHAPIPGTVSARHPGHSVAYNLLGTPEGYRQRVYGDSLPQDFNVSAESLVGTSSCWDIRETYDDAWARVFAQYDFAEHTASPESVIDMAQHFDLVVSSVPASVLCGNECTFASQEIWAAGEAPELGIELNYECDDMTVYCNGQPAKDGPSWYRISNLYGRKTVEWPGGIAKPPISSVARVHKPLFHNCQCLPGNVLRVGRYGAWRKGFLSHMAYSATANIVEEMTR